MNFTDSHCHLDFVEFEVHLQHLLAQCLAVGLARIIVPTVSPENWQKVLTLVNECKANPLSPTLYACLGIHPWYLKSLTEKDIEQLAQLANAHKSDIVAIGEIGIDGVIAKEQENMTQQVVFFSQQLNIATNLQLPAIIHHRRSHNEVIHVLKQQSFCNGGIVHGFSGSYQQAVQYIDMGFKLGIGGTITYPRAKKTLNALKRISIEHFVLETDAPAMPLHGEQGQINSPINTLKVFQTLVNILSIEPETLAQQLEDNVSQVLQLNAI